MSTGIEFVNLKNPAWHIGDVYWAQRPDAHFYQQVVYDWTHRQIGFGGREVVYLPGDITVFEFVGALNSLGNGFRYRYYAYRWMSPAEIRDLREAAAT